MTNPTDDEESDGAGEMDDDDETMMTHEQFVVKIKKQWDEQQQSLAYSTANRAAWYEQQPSDFVSVMRSGFGGLLTCEDVTTVAFTMQRAYASGQAQQTDVFEQERNNIPRAPCAALVSIILFYQIIIASDISDEASWPALLSVVSYYIRNELYILYCLNDII